jgi:hypothetical protein
MALTKLVITPLQAGYSAKQGQETLVVALDGGASRFRRDIDGAVYRVPVTWLTNGSGYRYLDCFYRGITQNGALPFLIDLIIHEGQKVEHQANFLSFKLAGKDGNFFMVEAELEVIPIPIIDADLDYVAMYNEFGGSFEQDTLLDDLDTLVNVTLPGDLPGSP